jgi:CRP-like cAMP-binding protein
MPRPRPFPENATPELLRGWPADAIKMLLDRARIVALDKGRVLFSKGDRGTSACLVLEGSLRITTPAADGREVLLALIGAGEIVGEIAMLDGQQRTATVTAETDCRIMILERRDVLETIRRHPEVAMRLLEVLCGRLRRTTRQVEELSFLPLPARLARTLLRHAAAQRIDLAAGQPITVTQRQLGESIALSREGTNRILRAWAKAGVLDLVKGRVYVRDAAALERLASADAISE